MKKKNEWWSYSDMQEIIGEYKNGLTTFEIATKFELDELAIRTLLLTERIITFEDYARIEKEK